MKAQPVGTRRLNHNGYVQIKTTLGIRRWPFEHRVVWEDAHGPIPPGYVMHHKNENRTDNRLENLELCESNSKHFLEHHAKKSAENMRKVGLAGKGRPKSAATRAKMSAYWSGRPKPPEHAAKSAAICRLNAEKRRGAKLSETQHAALRNGHRAYYDKLKAKWPVSICEQCRTSFIFKKARRFCCRSCCATWLNTHR